MQSCLQRNCAGHRGGLQGKFSGRQRKSAFWLPGGDWCLPLCAAVPLYTPVLPATAPSNLFRSGSSAERYMDQELLPAWDGRSDGFWCSRVNLERTVYWEKDPRPSFQGSSELNSAGTDRIWPCKATERLALHLSGIWLTLKFLAS